jgi:Domain of unknown function (DUF4111)/Nucleotidyltransferase domain
LSVSSVLDESVAVYAAEVAERVETRLGADLVGIWLFGSVALGDYDPRTSDVDIQAVARRRLRRQEKEALASALSHPALPCPARGLEFVLYPSDDLDDPGGPEFQLNLNTGRRMREHVAFDAAEDPRFWFVIDVAIGREHGIPLAGPPARAVFPEQDRDAILAALAEAVAWFAAHEGPSVQTVLSACRAWAFAEEGRWLSKRAAAEWARERL